MKAVAARPGDLVVFMVRRLGTSVNDRMGLLDMTTDDTCCDRGRSLRHGFLRERVVDDVDFASKRLESVREVGVAARAAFRGGQGQPSGVRDSAAPRRVAAPAGNRAWSGAAGPARRDGAANALRVADHLIRRLG